MENLARSRPRRLETVLWLLSVAGCIFVSRQVWMASGKLHETRTDHPLMSIFGILGLGVAAIAIAFLVLVVGRTAELWQRLLRIVLFLVSITFLWRVYRFSIDLFLVGQGR
jgi:formate-dependent nitrite reductase membrane component NrfD